MLARRLQQPISVMTDHQEGTMNTEMPVLLSFVGYRDPRPEGSEDDGPVLSLLGARSFARVVLFCTGGEYLERARSVEEITAGRDPAVSFSFVNLELESVVDSLIGMLQHDGYVEHGSYRELKRPVDFLLRDVSSG